MSDGNRMVQKGDVVHLALKPAVMGKVLFFSVDKVISTAGQIPSLLGFACAKEGRRTSEMLGSWVPATNAFS
jgi:hypothetical protein